jgi:hypothetical protein
VTENLFKEKKKKKDRELPKSEEENKQPNIQFVKLIFTRKS